MCFVIAVRISAVFLVTVQTMFMFAHTDVCQTICLDKFSFFIPCDQ